MANFEDTKIPELPEVNLLTAPDWVDYELLDSGAGRKLERLGPYRLIRPEPEAVWQPAGPQTSWNQAHAEFIPSPEENGGHWVNRKKLPESWVLGYKGLKFTVQTTASRHVGFFPEQASQWDWIRTQTRNTGRPIRVLNLFGYTGLASLAAAQEGAQVTHVDASRKVVTWAKENQTLSNLGEKPIRWLIDDVMKFVQREARRKSTYDGIILDPPKFGRGPKGEVWEFYNLLPNLLEQCREILSPQPRFVVLTAYAIKASSVTLYYAMREMMSGYHGMVQAGEVALLEKSAGRVISMAVYARWSAQ